MLKMLLLRFMHRSDLPYLWALKRLIDDAETWEECDTAVYEFVRVAGVHVPENTSGEEDYITAQRAVGFMAPEVKGDEAHKVLRVLFG